MCGIFAAMTRDGLPSDRCDQALKLLEHRGPDGTGTWTSRDGTWTLGHTRLSIIGLRHGSQPMTSPDGAVHVVVNGEFYGYRELREQLRSSGYRFTTDSDSEIALHLYDQRGMQTATQLRGEFAVVIADERQQAMFAIRDRFGVKPLYYAVVNGDVFFASEIKALLALGVPAKWDLEGVTGGFGRSHEKTEFDGISTVPPGCYAIARDGNVRIYPYWDWEMPTAEEMQADTRSEAEVVDDFREALRDAVKQRLVADVEVASYLSGGIDSCAVLGLAQQEMDRPIRAFTLTFDNALYDEASIAEAQAKRVGASYHPIPITGREIADSFADAVWHAETQMFNGHGVAKFLLSRAVRNAGIKVVFTGEGADEMLGGYPYFRVDAVNNDPTMTPEQRVKLLDEMLGANAATRALMMPERVSSPEMQAIERRLGWLPATLNVAASQANSIAPFFRDDLPASVREFQPLVSALDRLPVAQRVVGRDRLNQMLYVNAKTVMPNFILNYLADRMEMAHSIEGRVPFLDHHVAEAAARVPVSMKVKGIREKHVLREAAKDVLIPEVYDRQKHPFTTPPTRNPNDPMLEFYRDTFASQAAKDQPIFDMTRVSAALDQLLEVPADQRIAVEGNLQRVASVVVMQDLFDMA
ncbi:asparagine synthase (glutamine-hydrolyzing) [Mycolicibacterium moriokaense]|uniref:asparagine synthase (glutamine-hydrolyzing) n=1 Tax=Mycolicibacterium moriokaense TaxID=39691 RepID=A0AAD1HI23_9MYCO|nr:asparagine synthase (glutamine-hydrolyzing) [Mycolicibacterium moriokaense]MCV7042839.1 asparagine synthase (glutamine-hydrolyzing) [Mycolicibacterium moriokaense]ORB16721.1 asparagine synthase (glutamine-hydrolyzing) [Mycolicibacterium moriokaense]BBX04611.1 asparagine synthetase B [Mycolicibacterium moriokaense]